MKGSELTIEDAQKKLAEYVEHYIDDRGCYFEEATKRALNDMERNHDWYLVPEESIDGG